MNDETLQRLRPTEPSTHAIAEALSRLTDEANRVQVRQAELRALRPSMFLTATTAELRANQDAISDCESDLEQLQAIAEELNRQYALAADAEAAGERQKQFEAAAEAIEASNAWFRKHYLKHALPLAEGLALEQRALSLVNALQRDKRGVPAGLPALARAFVGNEARDFSYLVKLPGVEPGEAIHWQQQKQSAPPVSALAAEAMYMKQSMQMNGYGV
jgi:hypothetical protein